MLESFNQLTDVDKIERLKSIATLYRRHANILLTLEKRLGYDLIVSIQMPKDGPLTDEELLVRALEAFEGEWDLKYVHVYIKKEKQKFAMTHTEKFLLSERDVLVIAEISELNEALQKGYMVNGFQSPPLYFNGLAYMLYYHQGRLDYTQEEQAKKWLTHALIEKKKALNAKNADATVFTLEEFKSFFEERPSLSASAFSVEANFSDRYVRQLLNSDRRLTQDAAEKLLPIMKKYGFTFKSE